MATTCQHIFGRPFPALSVQSWVNAPLGGVGADSCQMGGRGRKKRPLGSKVGVDCGGRRGYWGKGEAEGGVLYAVT